MSRMLDKASAVAVAVTLVATLFAADTGAVAKGSYRTAEQAPVQMVSQPVVQPLPDQTAVSQEEAAADQAPAEDFTPSSAAMPSASSLAALVDAQPQGELSRELNCLAGAIYFESKSEPLEGQLAVGRVIVARTKSGRYPASYCGVVYQPSQFSFVRGNAMPVIRKDSHDWHEAVALARIADAGSWQSPVEGALSFHAARVSPGWNMKRVARLGNHVFYR